MSGTADLRAKPWFYTREAVMPTEAAEIDSAKLLPYMIENVAGFVEDNAQELKVFRFSNGYINSPYLVEYGEAQRYVLRKLDTEQKVDELFFGVKRGMGLEKTLDIMDRLNKFTDIPVPKVYGLCKDESVIGTPFYLIEFLDGRIFWNGTLSSVDPAKQKAISEQQRQEMYDAMCAMMVRVHAVDIHATGLKACLKKYNTHTAQYSPEVMIAHYQHEMKPFCAAHEKVARAIRTIEQHLVRKQSLNDRTSEEVFLHSDFHFENTIWHRTENRIIGLVDWEYCNIGNPFLDVAWVALSWCWDEFLVLYTPRQCVIPRDVTEDSFNERLPGDDRLLDGYLKAVRRFKANGGAVNVDTHEIEHNRGNWHFYKACQFFRLLGICADIHRAKSVLSVMFPEVVLEFVADLTLISLERTSESKSNNHNQNNDNNSNALSIVDAMLAGIDSQLSPQTQKSADEEDTKEEKEEEEAPPQSASDASAAVAPPEVDMGQWDERSQAIVILHQPHAWAWHSPNASPPCAKLEAFLALKQIPYEIDETAAMHPLTKKTPFITHKAQHRADSHLCYEYLCTQFGVEVDAHLTPLQKAVSRAYRSMIEDTLYWVLVYRRWSDESDECGEHFLVYCKAIVGDSMPEEAMRAFATQVRPMVVDQCHQQGISRYPLANIYRKGTEVIDSVIAYIAEKRFFFGEQISYIDLVIYGTLSGIYQCPFPWKDDRSDGSGRRGLPGKPFINEYIKRVEMECFGSLKFWKDIVAVDEHTADNNNAN